MRLFIALLGNVRPALAFDKTWVVSPTKVESLPHAGSGAST
jgi:hypothetical protein